MLGNAEYPKSSWGLGVGLVKKEIADSDIESDSQTIPFVTWIVC